MQAPQAGSSQPAWACAGKDMVGTSLGSSRLWFTVAQGIVTEVYYPRIDIPQIKDLGFIIADDRGFWVELRRLGNYEVSLPKPGVPAVTVVHRHPRFTFTLQICPSQQRDTLLLRYRLQGDESLRPYALLSARLGGDAKNNQASVGKHNGRTVLQAEQGPFALALVARANDGSDAWQRCSAGCFGASDGWQDFDRHGRMTWQYDSAGPGAVSLTGELPDQATLALAFGTSQGAAATLAVASLMEDFSTAWDTQCRVWHSWQAGCKFPELPGHLGEMLALSGMVLKVHQDRTYTGAAVASLAVPWGESSREPWRLSPGVVSRPGRDRGRTGGHRCARGCARCVALPDRHATGRRTLAAESVAGRRSILAGHPAGRGRVSGAAGCRTARAGRPRRHTGHRHGAAGTLVHCPRRSDHRTGSLGRGPRYQYIHACHRHRGTGRGQYLSRRRGASICTPARGQLECTAR